MGILLPGPCPCGSFIRRILPWGGRRADRGRLWELDGVLLACPEVVDYSFAETAEGLELTLFGVVPPDCREAGRRLAQAGLPPPSRISARTISGFSGTGMQKRGLSERRA